MWRIAVACTSLAVVMAACGDGGARLGTQEFTRESSEVCERANRAIARITTTDPARASVRIVTIHRESVDDLRDLRPPKSSEGTAKLWIGLVDQSLDELDEMRALLHDGRARAAADYAEKAAVLATRARDVAREHDITPCRVPQVTVS
jgi:hypothetical protein